MEIPSATRFANPKTMITNAESPAPAAPEITAKVVIMPSFAPKTKSPMYNPFSRILFC